MKQLSAKTNENPFRPMGSRQKEAKMEKENMKIAEKRKQKR